VVSASWTVTCQPARAIVIAAASPFGPEPMTTASGSEPGPVDVDAPAPFVRLAVELGRDLLQT